MINKSIAVAKLLREIAPKAEVLRVYRLEGGVSAEVTAIEYRDADGSTETAVVRQHGAADLAWTPNVAEVEYKLLSLLAETDVPAPRPLYLDLSCTAFPTPVIVLTFIDGEIDMSADGAAAKAAAHAEMLARIHTVTAAAFDLSFLPRQSDRCDRWLKRSNREPDVRMQEAVIAETLRAHWPLPRRNADTLLQGDYWPGNVIVKDGKIAGVIDWEDAVVGDPIEDLAVARMELLWVLGEEAMEIFTAHYLNQRPDVDVSALPLWDLMAALRPTGQLSRWAMAEARKEHIRKGHAVFVRQALERIN